MQTPSTVWLEIPELNDWFKKKKKLQSVSTTCRSLYGSDLASLDWREASVLLIETGKPKQFDRAAHSPPLFLKYPLLYLLILGTERQSSPE